MKLSRLLLAFLSLVPATLSASEEHAGASRKRIEATVRFLADDLLEGRGTPGRGLDISGLFLANQLYALGWSPASDGSYYQKFSTGYFSPAETRYQISINGQRLADSEYYFLPFGLDPRTTPVTFPIVFAGYGIHAPERGVDDFGAIELASKAVVSLQGAPWEPDNEAPHSYDRIIGKSVPVTVRGGGCLIYVSEDLARPATEAPGPDASFVREMVHAPYAFLADAPNVPTMGMGPVLAITPSVFDRTLSAKAGGTYTEWRQRLGSGNSGTRPLEASISIAVDTRVRSAPAANVAAVLRGTDPELREDWIVISAHYDHLGFKTTEPGVDGIWNGADDNASGTASVLELARHLVNRGPFKRSLMVLFTAGEDRGMLGSAHHALHPLVPLEKIVADVNIDMVGRYKGSLTAYTEGEAELFRLARDSGQRRGLSVTADEHPSWRVLYFLDSYHFARFGIPFIELFTSMHTDYHQPSDEADLIRYDELARITDVAFDVVVSLANSEIRPVFTAPEWFVVPSVK